MTVPVFPDVEMMLMYVLVRAIPNLRFVTVLPAGDPTGLVARIRRSSGANRNIGIDRPVVDIDIFGLKSDTENVSTAARTIQSQMLSLMSAVTTDGVIVHVTTVSGPRQLPEANPNFVRYN